MPITALRYIQNSKQSNTFVGVFRYVKTSGVKTTKEGELYGFLEISSGGDFPAERVAHMAWDGVIEGYMYSNIKSTSESLKSAITEFTRRLKDLMRNSKSLEQVGIDVSLVIVATTKEGIYLANIGENEIFAYKAGKIVNVVDVLDKNKAQTAGFAIGSDDLVIISTNSLLTENMHLLIGKSCKEDILKGLNILGKTLLLDQGLLCIHIKEEDDAEQVALIKQSVYATPDDIKEKVSEKTPIQAEPLQEGKRVKVKKFKIKKFDVRGNIAVLFDIFKKIGIFFGRVFNGISKFFRNIFSKVVGLLGQRLGNKKWFKRYAAKASEMRLGKRGSPSIKVDGYKTKDLRTKRFRIAILAALTIVVVVGGYQYTRKQKVLRELHVRVDGIFGQVESKLSSAQEKLSTDREGAKTDIFAIGNLLDKVPDGIDQEYVDKLNSLEKEVLGVEDSLYRRVEVSPESLIGFFDEGSELEDMKYLIDDSGNEILILTDSGVGKVYRVFIFSKDSKEMADNDGVLKNPMYVDIGEDSSIFVYDKTSGVVKASKQDSGWGPFEKITGAGIGNIKIDKVSEFGVYSDNLYYLDSNNGKILKSVNYGSGYSSSTVVSVENDALMGTTDFFADFSIYALSSGNEGLLRFTFGEPTPVTVTGFNGELGDLCCGDTTVNQDFGLYVYDSTNKRILRFEKPKDSYNDKLHPNEMVLLSQYIYRGPNDGMWDDVKELVVDRSEEYMYMLDGNTVWRIGL